MAENKEPHRMEYTKDTMPKPTTREEAVKKQEQIRKETERMKRRSKRS